MSSLREIDTLAAKSAPAARACSAFDEARFEALLRDIAARRDEFRENRCVSQDVIERLQVLGLYRAFVPEYLGGSGMHPCEFLRLIERISAADGSAGWVASFAFATKYLSSLPVKTLEAIYADTPDIVFAGVLFPQQPAERVEGGVRVSGRWKFGSGSMGASLIGVGVQIEDGDKAGLPLMAVMPADKVRIDETWDTIGLIGTGSHDLVVEDVFVPDDWLLVRGSAPSIDTPAYRYPSLAMAAQVLAVCGLGVARAAIDHVVEVAGRAKSITGAPTLGDRANVQLRLAEAEANLRAARSWFYERTEAAWEEVRAGRTLSRTLNMELRLAASHAARVAADAARGCFEMSGTIGIFNDNPLSRYLGDALVVAQHAFLAEGTFVSAGRAMVGQPPTIGFD